MFVGYNYMGSKILAGYNYRVKILAGYNYRGVQNIDLLSLERGPKC